MIVITRRFLALDGSGFVISGSPSVSWWRESRAVGPQHVAG